MRRRPAAVVCLRVVAALLAVVAIDAVDAAVSLRADARGTEARLRQAMNALHSGNLTRARGHLAAAASASDSATAAIRRPAFRIVGATPWLDADIAALEALTLAANASANAALAPLRAVRGEELASALFHDGRVDVAAIDDLREGSARSVAMLDAAARSLATLERPSLAPVARAVEDARGEVAAAASDATTMDAALEALPAMVGAAGEKRYLLAFLNPAQARGGGGLIGMFSILSADDGRLGMERAASIRDIVHEVRGTARAPRWYDSTWGDLLGTRSWREANLSPTFPVAADLWLQMYQRAADERLDGVIAMDPHVLGQLTRGIGPLRARNWLEQMRARDARQMLGLGQTSAPTSTQVAGGWNREITRRSAASVLMHDIFLQFHRLEYLQNRYLKGIVDSAWRAIGSSDVDVSGLIRGIGSSAAGGHLKVYARDPAHQQVLRDVGLSGDPRAFGDDVQMVFHNNFIASKVDYFLNRKLDMDIRVKRNGDAVVTTTATLANQAPATGPSTVLLRSGADRDAPLGVNRMTVSFTAPVGSRIRSLTVDGRRSFYMSGKEGPFPMAWQLVTIPAGTSRDVSATYLWPDAVKVSGGERSLEMTLLPQVTPNVDAFDLAISSEHFQVDGDARLRGRLSRARTVTAVLEPISRH